MGRTRRLAALLLAVAVSVPAHAEQQPLWEFGLGVGALGFNDYRGSEISHVYPVPIPYIRYNGRFLKADRDGVRGTLFNRDRFELNLSFNATTPVRNDRARDGMPDLKTTVEVGPALNIHLLRSNDARVKLDLRLPLRAALTIDAPPRYIGWTFSPHVNLDLADPFGYAGWHLGLLTGPLFAEHRYHDYFYSVAGQYATPSRPQYAAPGGYAGTQMVAALSKRYPKFWVGAFMRYDTLSAAAFADSPLVRRNGYWTAGFGFAWMISQSAQQVDAPD